MEVDEMMKFFRKTAVLLLLAVLAASFLTTSAAALEDVRALFINVRKADAALFFLGDARYLVDTGHKNSFDQLQRVLEAFEIQKLDGVFVTHTDKDHVGGLKKLLKGGMQVDMLYASALHSEKSDEDHPVYEAAEKYAVPLTWLKAGDQVDAGNGCVFNVIGPLYRDAQKENNNSLVMYLETPHGTMLLTGDMEKPEEADLLSAGVIRHVPVLKVGNHGEGDATGKDFAMAVRPDWSIISTNTEDEPDTPDDDTLSRLYKTGTKIAVTQDAEVGIMVILRDGKVADVQQVNWQ